MTVDVIIIAITVIIAVVTVGVVTVVFAVVVFAKQCSVSQETHAELVVSGSRRVRRPARRAEDRLQVKPAPAPPPDWGLLRA